MMESKKKSGNLFTREFFFKLVFEILSVVLAVSLALIANEWRRNQSNHKLVLNAWSNIKNEISLNKEKLETILPYYDSLWYIVDSAITIHERKTEDVSVDFEGIEIEILSSTAWVTINSTDVINYMKFEHIMKIGEVYNSQKVYTDIVDNFISLQQVSVLNTKEVQIELLYSTRLYLGHFMGVGRQIITGYDEAMELLRDNYPDL